MSDLPQLTRSYQNHHIDGPRWQAFEPRPDDIVIATSYKSGTTWTQAIVAHLLFPDQDFPKAVWQMSPWLDFRSAPFELTMEALRSQSHRRFIKTHLALDGLPYFPEVKYIFVSRDGRDVFMSLWNHYQNYTDEAMAKLNDPDGMVGDPFPPIPQDIHQSWHDWCTRGWFDWEQDGWPFWSHLHVTKTWWVYRHLPNILTLHFADMKRDLPGAVARVADFLEIPVTKEILRRTVDAVSIDEMRARGQDYVPRGGAAWKGGVKSFLNKGANKQWVDIFSPEELALYDQACERTLEPACRAWLDHGGAL